MIKFPYNEIYALFDIKNIKQPETIGNFTLQKNA